MSTPAVGLLYLGTDHLLEVPGRTAGGDKQALTNGLTGAALTGATVQATLLDSDRNEVAGETWPVTLEEDAEFPGRYLTVLSADVEITAQQDLICRVIADAGDGLQRTWYLPLVAAEGGF